MNENLLTIVTYVLCVALGFGLYFILTKLGVSKAHDDASRIVDEANSKADNIVKEAILDAKTPQERIGPTRRRPDPPPVPPSGPGSLQ